MARLVPPVVSSITTDHHGRSVATTGGTSRASASPARLAAVAVDTARGDRYSGGAGSSGEFWWLLP